MDNLAKIVSDLEKLAAKRPAARKEILAIAARLRVLVPAGDGEPPADDEEADPRPVPPSPSPPASGNWSLPPGLRLPLGAPPVDPQKFVVADGIEKWLHFPIVDSLLSGQPLTDRFLRLCRENEVGIKAVLAGNFGGGSVNHCGSRINAAMADICSSRKYPPDVVANVRRLAVSWCGSQSATGHKVLRGRDESQGYNNYNGGAALVIFIFAHQLGWTDAKEAARQWLLRDIAYASLCYHEGGVWTAHRRGSKPGPETAWAMAFETLVRGKIHPDRIYRHTNVTGTVSNRYAYYAALAVKSGLWTPAPAQMSDLPPVGGDWTVARGEGYYLNQVDRFFNPSGDYTHFGVLVRDGKATWWSQRGGEMPETPKPWGALPVPTEEWRGNLNGWRRTK